MTRQDSKAMWFDLRAGQPEYDVRLGPATALGYVHGARRTASVTSRHTVCARVPERPGTALEVGCCDALCAPIVSEDVDVLICIDFDEQTIAHHAVRCADVFNTNRAVQR